MFICVCLVLTNNRHSNLSCRRGCSRTSVVAGLSVMSSCGRRCGLLKLAPNGTSTQIMPILQPVRQAPVALKTMQFGPAPDPFLARFWPSGGARA